MICEVCDFKSSKILSLSHLKLSRRLPQWLLHRQRSQLIQATQRQQKDLVSQHMSCGHGQTMIVNSCNQPSYLLPFTDGGLHHVQEESSTTATWLWHDMCRLHGVQGLPKSGVLSY